MRLCWQQAEGKRHALEGRESAEGGSFVAQCGAEVTVLREDILELGGHWFVRKCVARAVRTQDAGGMAECAA